MSCTSSPADYNAHRYTLRGDLAREFQTRFPSALKFGVSFDTMQNDQRRFPKTWTFTPNGAIDATSRLNANFGFFADNDPSTVFGTPVRWISTGKVYQLYQKNPSWFVENPAVTWQNFVTSSRAITERISAAYIRTDVHLLKNRLLFVGGVRFERTDDRGSGPQDEINAQYQRNSDGTFATNAAGQRILITSDTFALSKLRFQERAATAVRTYDGYYPSLNARYSITENLFLRAAAAKTLGRPDLNYIIPGVTISASTAAIPTITVNNVGLKPWEATSYDLSLESYQIKDGFGTLSIFQKDLHNFFILTSTAATPELLRAYDLDGDPTLANYTISTRANGGDAKVQGVEFSYRQSLTFLPHWARGVQLFVNISKLRLSGGNATDFNGFIPETASGGIRFIRSRFAIKSTITYTGCSRISAVTPSATIPANTYTYIKQFTRIGLDAQYAINRHYAIYASATDLQDSLMVTERYTPDTPGYARPARRQQLGFYTHIGVRGSF